MIKKLMNEDEDKVDKYRFVLLKKKIFLLVIL